MEQHYAKKLMYAIAVMIASICIQLAYLPAYAEPLTNSRLIVVEDKGGVSTQPYFEELGLLAEQADNNIQRIEQPLIEPITDSDMLPVRSERLTPDTVTARAIQAPRLTPIFLIGEDDLSKRWLRYRYEALQEIHAIGLVVNVETVQGLAELRALVPGLRLYPVSGDDIAERLNIHHYPVLITPTSIEQ